MTQGAVTMTPQSSIFKHQTKCKSHVFPRKFITANNTFIKNKQTNKNNDNNNTTIQNRLKFPPRFGSSWFSSVVHAPTKKKKNVPVSREWTRRVEPADRQKSVFVVCCQRADEKSTRNGDMQSRTRTVPPFRTGSKSSRAGLGVSKKAWCSVYRY